MQTIAEYFPSDLSGTTKNTCYCQLQIGTCHGRLPSTSTRIISHAAAAADFPQPLKGVQGGEQT